VQLRIIAFLLFHVATIEALIINHIRCDKTAGLLTIWVHVPLHTVFLPSHNSLLGEHVQHSQFKGYSSFWSIVSSLDLAASSVDYSSSVSRAFAVYGNLKLL